MKAAVLGLIALSACGGSTREVSTAAPPRPAATPAKAAPSADLCAVSGLGDEPLRRLSCSKPREQIAIQQGAVEIHGRFDPALLRRFVRTYLYEPFRVCYRKELARDPSLGGRVVVRFTMDASGKVSKAESDAATDLPSPEMVACVVAVFRAVELPRSESGEVEVVDPLVFAASRR